MLSAMADDSRPAKTALRSAVREQRATVSAPDRDERRDGLTRQLAALITERGATSLTAYVPLGTEPDVSGFLQWARDTGVRVLLPIALAGHRLEWARDTGARVIGRHGIAEPDGPRLGAGAAAEVDLMIVPACAVDEHGTRLGWGLGYYDRLLASLARRPPVYAVVDDADIFESLPRDAHDVPIDGAVTPTRIIRFATG